MCAISSESISAAPPRSSLIAAPTVRPMKIQRPAPPVWAVVARNTSAQAVPSG